MFNWSGSPHEAPILPHLVIHTQTKKGPTLKPSCSAAMTAELPPRQAACQTSNQLFSLDTLHFYHLYSCTLYLAGINPEHRPACQTSSQSI
eukprot:1159301-Pelagomonas_calceolata.AAC.5